MMIVLRVETYAVIKFKHVSESLRTVVTSFFLYVPTLRNGCSNNNHFHSLEKKQKKARVCACNNNNNNSVNVMMERVSMRSDWLRFLLSSPNQLETLHF